MYGTRQREGDYRPMRLWLPIYRYGAAGRRRPLPSNHVCPGAWMPRRVTVVGRMVRVIPLSEREMRTAFLLIDRVTREVGEPEFRALGDLGLRRRRVFVVRDATGSWLIDAMDGDQDIVGLGPEAVWATSACGLDRWIAARQLTSYVGDSDFLPETAPALDLHFTRDEAPVDAQEVEDELATRMFFMPGGQHLS